MNFYIWIDIGFVHYLQKRLTPWISVEEMERARAGVGDDATRSDLSPLPFAELLNDTEH